MFKNQMNLKQIRITMLIVGLSLFILLVAFVLVALKDNLVYFYSPTKIHTLTKLPQKTVRVGGMVLEGSWKQEGLKHQFSVTDYQHNIHIIYHGIVPDLFREGQGVVAQGYFDKEKSFIADTILAKHDETYMPPEVADSLRQSEKVRTRQ